MTLGDSELCAAIGARDADAEAELFRRFQPRVLRMVNRALSGGPDCEDLASEILQGALASLRRGNFRGDCQLGTFIHAVARNQIAAHFRKRRPETTELNENIPDQGRSPCDVALDEEMGLAIRAVLERLKPKYRQVLFLYYFHGLSVAQIAARLEAPPRRVSEWKNYALKVIRSRFGKRLDRFR